MRISQDMAKSVIGGHFEKKAPPKYNLDSFQSVQISSRYLSWTKDTSHHPNNAHIGHQTYILWPAIKAFWQK